MKSKLTLAVACLLFGSAATAEKASMSPAGSKEFTPGWTYSLSLSYLSITGEAAEAQGLGDNGFSLELAGNYQFNRNYGASLGFSFLSLKDDSGFSQVVVDQNNDVAVAESSATALPLFAELYYQNSLPNNADWQYRLGSGYTTVTGASRDIANCVNCFSDEFEIEGGGYLSASLGKSLNTTSSIGFSARQYVSGDIENSVMVWWRSNR